VRCVSDNARKDWGGQRHGKGNRDVSVQIYFTDGREKDCLGSMGTNIDCSARIVGDDIKV
jgi:hypothetical protein